MENKSNKDDFYIGWQAEAPDSFAKPSRNAAIVAILIVLISMAILVLNQRGFADSVFEFGKETTFEGYLNMSPYPMLMIVEEHTVKENILLVGLGKFGAEHVIEKFLRKEKLDLEPEELPFIKLRGTLIYDQGQKILELTEGEDSFLSFQDSVVRYDFDFDQLGTQSFKGEILDPKCAFGVMKPGYGKPHRSCAIRCISGGIAPVFRIKYEGGETIHALLVTSEGKKKDGWIPYVADQVQICGELRKFHNWYYLIADPDSQIQRISYYGIEGAIRGCGG